MDLGRGSEALTAAHAALDIARELESPRLQATALQLISTVARSPGWILLDADGFSSGRWFGTSILFSHILGV